MHVQLTDELAPFSAAVEGFLGRDPVRNNVALTVLEMLRVGGGYSDGRPWFGWATHAGEVVGAALRTPPHLTLLCAMPPDVAAAFGEACRDREMPGAVGPAECVSAFAAGAGRAHRVNLHEVQHVLHELVAPPAVAGEPRPWQPADADCYVRWMDAFHREAGLTSRPSDALRALDQRLRAGGAMTLWSVAGEPVALAGRSVGVHGIARLGPVWTVPEHRRHGYAAAVTAAVCADALLSGASACTLYADAANPTSNGVYERLGFAPVGAVVEAVFDAA
jgi:RimJ/RimL family protein N-acetyltransferase